MENFRSLQERIKYLEEKIATIKQQLPKHSVQPAMIIELEDLEDELDQALRESGSERGRIA